MSMQQEPSENDIFAMSDPFSGAAAEAFSGVDAFSPGGPIPVFASAPNAPIEMPDAVHASCLEIQGSIPFLLDGELTAMQQQAVQNHVDLCPPCQRAQMFQSQLRTVVAEKAIDPMPEDVRARITRALGFE